MADRTEQDEYLSSVTRHIAEAEKRIEVLRDQIANLASRETDTRLQEKMLSIMIKTVETMKRHRDQLAALPPFPPSSTSN